MKLTVNGNDVSLRLFGNDSGSVSVQIYDESTGDRIATIARFQTDGTLRRLKNLSDLGFETDDNGRIEINESSLRSNANR